MSTSAKGLLWSFFGVLILSPDTLLIRLLNLSDFSLIFYRSFLPAISIFLFIFWNPDNFLTTLFTSEIICQVIWKVKKYKSIIRILKVWELFSKLLIFLFFKNFWIWSFTIFWNFYLLYFSGVFLMKIFKNYGVYFSPYSLKFQ